MPAFGKRGAVPLSSADGLFIRTFSKKVTLFRDQDLDFELAALDHPQLLHRLRGGLQDDSFEDQLDQVVVQVVLRTQFQLEYVDGSGPFDFQFVGFVLSFVF